MSSNFKISGQERRDLKKLLNEYKAYEKGFWHYHQLDKDMCAFITPIGGMQKDTKAYPMSDEEAQKRYDELLTKINKIDKKLEEKMSKDEALDKLLALEKKLTMMFDSNVRVALALLDEIRKLNQNKDE
jgi:hypothetical protein